MRTLIPLMSVSVLLLSSLGCGSSTPSTSSESADVPAATTVAQPAVAQPFESVRTPDGTPEVTAAYSPYTSWSALASADAFGYIDNRAGYMGEYEVKYGVDVELRLVNDYVDSFTHYIGGTVDMVTVTNTDALSIAEGRFKTSGDATVLTTMTSWSDGADQGLANADIATFADLAGVTVYGAEASVSQYLFWRACQINGVGDRYGTDFVFANKNPAAAWLKFSSGKSDDFQVLTAWSPETFKVLDARNGNEDSSDDVHALFDSSMLEDYEIVDALIVGQAVLDRPGGSEAVQALSAAMQEMTNRTKNSAQQAETFRAISPQFYDLDNGYISRAVDLTKMMGPADAAILNSPQFRANMTTHVVGFSVAHGLISSADNVPIGWGTKSEASDAILRIDTSYTAGL